MARCSSGCSNWDLGVWDELDWVVSCLTGLDCAFPKAVNVRDNQSWAL